MAEVRREGWPLFRHSPARPLLPLVRRLFLAFLLVNLVVVLFQWAGAPAVPLERSWPVLPALAALAGSALTLYKRARPMPLADLATGVVVWAVGLNGAGGVLFVGVTFRALYGGPSGLLLAVSLITAGLIGGTLGGGGTIGDAHLSEYLPGLLITSVALQVVAVSLRRYETSAAARFHAIVRSSRDVLVITDAETVPSFVSPALTTVFGVPEGALPGGRLLSRRNQTENR